MKSKKKSFGLFGQKEFIMGSLTWLWIFIHIFVAIPIKVPLLYVVVVTVGIFRWLLIANEVSYLWELVENINQLLNWNFFSNSILKSQMSLKQLEKFLKLDFSKLRVCYHCCSLPLLSSFFSHLINLWNNF